MRNADLLWTNTWNCTFGVIHEVFLIANFLVGERGVYMTTISKHKQRANIRSDICSYW